VKNERQKLASTAAPIESAEPGGRGWLPSLRPSWLPAKPDAGASAKNALEQERAQAENERMALLKQLSQAQDALERLGLTHKALEEDAKTLTQDKQGLSREVTALQSNLAAEAKAKTEVLAKAELEAKAKVDAQRKLEAETKAKTALQNEKTALAQDKQSLSQEVTALKASLASEAKAKAQAEEEGTLLLAQLHQVQEELERYYLANKALEKDASALAQEKAALGQEKAKAIAARDAEAKAKT